MDDTALAKLIAENMPSPMAQSVVWKHTEDGVVLNFAEAGEIEAQEWRELARVVRKAFER